MPERVQKINNKQATIHDDYVEKYLREENYDSQQHWMLKVRMGMRIML